VIPAIASNKFKVKVWTIHTSNAYETSKLQFHE
jgi:hypothetical protein